MTKNNTKSYSFPFFSILGLIFITLKLMGEITWSWWWSESFLGSNRVRSGDYVDRSSLGWCW